MTPEQLRLALPCYVCGDLPPELAAAVRAKLAEHPELAARVQELERSRALCEALLRRQAPVEAGARPRGGVVPQPAPARWVAGVVALGLLAVIAFVV